MTTPLKLKVWRSETRPNTGVSFWSLSAEDRQYIDETYKTAGLLLDEETTISDDQLTQTRTLTWTKVPGMVTILLDDETLKAQEAKNDEYNQLHGITKSLANYHVVDQNNTVLVTGVFHN